MALELKQQLKLAQQLVMTPQLQQAIKLLQLSRLELVETIQQEIEQNPLLEEEIGQENTAEADNETPLSEMTPETPEFERTPEIQMETGASSLEEINWADYANEYESAPPRAAENGDMPSRLDILSQKPSLKSHLEWQLNFSDLSEAEKEIGLFIIGNLNRNGFLEVEISEIMEQTGADEDAAQHMVNVIQEMDPAGVCAHNLRECLLLQLARLGLYESLPASIIRDHIHNLEIKNYAAIAKATKSPIAEVLAAVEIITGLDPHPGRSYSDEEPQYILPDVYVHKIGDEYVIMVNDDGLPRLKISSFYKDILTDGRETPGATKEYIRDKMRSAAWLIKSIQQRQRTIYKVVESLLKFQYDFFEKGVDFLKPLILKDVADDIEMHESTISRVTSNKYVHTPQGIFELKYFFTSAIGQDNGEALSSSSIREKMRRLFQAENPEKPLSDLAIAKIMQEEGIQLARRTVAKYREQMGVLPSPYRKRPKLS